MSRPPDKDDDLLRDSTSLRDAHRWWQENVDADAQAKELVKAVREGKAKKVAVVDTLLAYWNAAKNSRLLPLGIAAAAVFVAAVTLFNRPHSSTELASLGTLEFEPQSLIRAFNPSAYEGWVGQKPRLQFSPDGQVTLETDSGTVVGSWSRNSSSEPPRLNVALDFREVVVEGERRMLKANLQLTLPTPGQNQTRSEIIPGVQSGVLSLTFSRSSQPPVTVQRVIAGAR
jgi:hypothetical protein